MRKIDVSRIRDTVRSLCLKANFELRKDVLDALKRSLKTEKNVRAKKILRSIVDNAELAKKKKLAICQDTGVVFVYLKIGQGIVFTGGGLQEAINDGIKSAYKDGCLRKSVVDDALLRKNTGTNMPGMVTVDIVKGNKVHVAVSPKGFGSENKSMIKMFRPTANINEIKSFIMDIVKYAGPDACPPMILGIGIGGTFDTAALLAKKALLRNINKRNPKKHFKDLENSLLKRINAFGPGPMGLGGRTTALAVNIMDMPTHIAGLPVAVNVSCHATRLAEKTI